MSHQKLLKALCLGTFLIALAPSTTQKPWGNLSTRETPLLSLAAHEDNSQVGEVSSAYERTPSLSSASVNYPGENHEPLEQSQLDSPIAHLEEHLNPGAATWNSYSDGINAPKNQDSMESDVPLMPYCPKGYGESTPDTGDSQQW
ncbi:uncharacterized protein MELLADRAFT_123582 [Melampsora larici-populina 98AG31]|uniref:Secreted protein n=1 Tax=Melampsora larici-populina (strain 98AG31 / pathotype 3-4-7) TaxID=747676 RepID=F4RGI0_MELLP|nr:uncharacterized protein MELLADRAFT_123582 [Melampsora larici-populina 98AG31]EGG08645.1 secreted protein [Melampsora larici-populina 98AG31]